MKRKPAIAAWGSGFFAGCLSHTGSIRGGQAKGPGFSFLEHSPDSLPHLVPGGEFRAKFLKILILPTQCCTCPEAFPRLCSSSVLSHHFSIYSSVLKSDWHLLIEETKSPLGHALASMLQATLFFSSIYMGYLHLKMRGKKQKNKKGDLASRFQSSVCIYANSPCLGQQDIESLCVVCWMVPSFWSRLWRRCPKGTIAERLWRSQEEFWKWVLIQYWLLLKNKGLCLLFRSYAVPSCENLFTSVLTEFHKRGFSSCVP